MAKTNHRMFHNTTGNSFKFYEMFIENEGGWKLYMIHGRIGSRGRTITKDFGSQREALAALNDKIREKTRRGYYSVEDDTWDDENVPVYGRRRQRVREREVPGRKKLVRKRPANNLPEAPKKRRNIIRD